MQRFLLIFGYLLWANLIAAPFAGYVTLAMIDTFSGYVEKILLTEHEQVFSHDQQFLYKIQTIEQDEENPEVAWIDLTIYYKPNSNDDYQCIQQGKLSTNQVYHFFEDQYLLGFYILPIIDEERF